MSYVKHFNQVHVSQSKICVSIH